MRLTAGSHLDRRMNLVWSGIKTMRGGGNILLLRNNAANVHMDAWGTVMLHNRYDISEDVSSGSTPYGPSDTNLPSASCLLSLEREAGQVHRATMGFEAGRGCELKDWVMTSPSC